MHIAAATGHITCVKLLLAAGGHPSSKDNFGRTPLLEALRGGFVGVSDLLHEFGAVTGLNDSEDPDASASGSDVLAGGEMCQAAFRGDAKYVALLLKYGVNPNACGAGGALCWAGPRRRRRSPPLRQAPRLYCRRSFPVR